MNFTRHSWRRGAALGIIGALIGALAACGGDGDSASADDTITLWQYYGDPDMPTGAPLYDLVERYEEESGTDVEVRFIPFDDFNRTLLQSAAGGDLPDVALINAFDTAAMAEAGVIQDLGDRVEEWGEEDAYFETSWSTGQFDGSTYGIPHLADAYALYYNKAMLDDAGLEPPQTWDEMATAAETLSTTDGRTGLAVSGVEGAEGATGLIIRLLAAGGAVEEIDSPAGVEALEDFASMADSGAISPGFLTWIEDDVKNQFAQERAAMMINSATYVSLLREETPDLEWDVSLLPADETATTFLSAENLSIGATSENADAAWDLIEFMQEPEELETYLPERNKLPARDDVPGTAEDPIRAVFAEQLQEAWAPEGDVAATSGEIFTHVQRALQATVSGTATAQEAAAQAQEAIDEALGAE